MPSATPDDLLAGLAEILHEVVATEPAEVVHDKRFVDDLLVDSLSMVEVVVALEQKFGIVIPDDSVKDLRTVGDAVDCLQRQVQSAAT